MVSLTQILGLLIIRDLQWVEAARGRQAVLELAPVLTPTENRASIAD
jgi:hypothetical protein